MKPSFGPGKGQKLAAFLKAQSQIHPALHIDVTGHSLGGALAPTLALWLADTEKEWNVNWRPTRGAAEFAVYTLAGPTAGNLEFANYYDSSLGPRTHRLQNPYDIVPLAWNVETMGRIDDLYASAGIQPDDTLRGVIDHLRDAVKDKGYSQIKSGEEPLSGGIKKDGKDFLEEAGWQHHCGYKCALKIDVTPTADCSNPPEDPCAPCPAEPQQGSGN